MSTCPMCGARWDSDDPFCPECSSPKEEQDSSAQSDATIRDSEQPQLVRDKAGNQEADAPPNNDFDYTAVAYGKNATQNPAEHNPNPEPGNNSEPDVAAYGSAVLAVDTDEAQAAIEETQQRPSSIPPASTTPAPEGQPSSADADAVMEAEKPVAESDEETERPERARTSEPPPKVGEARDSHPPARPPVLASEALRKELAPLEPGHGSMRALSVMIGLAGAMVSLVLAGGAGMAIPLTGAFLGIALLGVTPIPYAARAVAVVTISACALGLVTWMHFSHSGPPAAVIETISIALLASALFFRAWHRASFLARALVLLGLLACTGWLGMSGTISDFATLDPAWQSWLPTVLRAPFGLLLMLSLLAFMDERSTGGCSVWATFILLWHGVNMGLQLATQAWPPELSAPDWTLVRRFEAITLVANPLLAAIVAYGTAQLLAVAMAVEPTAEPEID